MMRALLFVLSIQSIPSLCMAAEPTSIGRLFLTPAERGQLDQLREHGEPKKILESEAPTSSIPEPKVPPVEQFTFDGYVTRSSGKNTVWINQVPQNEHEKSQVIHVWQQRSKTPVVSLTPSPGKPLNLKVGQTFDKSTGKIVEVYAPIRPPAQQKAAD
ncbi:hypothetical protein ACO0K9_16340 [Undibacterium sp. Ji50W]